jgi:hypothetical protein
MEHIGDQLDRFDHRNVNIADTIAQLVEDASGEHPAGAALRTQNDDLSHRIGLPRSLVPQRSGLTIAEPAWQGQARMRRHHHIGR